jgi:hypothetical protein
MALCQWHYEWHCKAVCDWHYLHDIINEIIKVASQVTLLKWYYEWHHSNGFKSHIIKF